MNEQANGRAPKHTTVYVCTNERVGKLSCAQQRSKVLLRALQKRAEARAQAGGPRVEVCASVCMGYCDDGPNVKTVGGALMHGAGVDDVDAILDAAEAVKRD